MGPEPRRACWAGVRAASALPEPGLGGISYRLTRGFCLHLRKCGLKRPGDPEDTLNDSR